LGDGAYVGAGVIDAGVVVALLGAIDPAEVVIIAGSTGADVAGVGVVITTGSIGAGAAGVRGKSTPGSGRKDTGSKIVGFFDGAGVGLDVIGCVVGSDVSSFGVGSGVGE